LNPQGLIPALEHNGEVVGQSLAIIEYLDEVFPNPPLLPRSPFDRATVRAMALLIACDIHPLNNLRVLNYLKDPLQQDTEAVGNWYRHWITQGFIALEIMAAKHTSDAQYCFANSVTIADIMLVPQVANARRFQTDLSLFPTLANISTHLETLPAFAAARPEVQPDAE
jgi:maleylacetoacetate isomerase